jgi:nitrous oxide reductase accessory protein NosL
MKTAAQRAALAVALAFTLAGAPPRAAAAEPPADVRAAPSCRYCGMDREKFAHSRMVVEYEDGTSVGLCSLHCAALELAVSIERTPRSIQVADHGTRLLVDAEKAVWVLGGSVPGVMTARAKWAFADRAAADAFVKANGGTVATFEDAMRATYEDMYRDSKAIREKRRLMRARHPQPAPAAHEPPGAHAHPAPAAKP